MSSFNFKQIGVVKTPFADKFAVPRQSGMAEGARGVIKLLPDPDLKTALRTLEEFSHLWILFVFHEHGSKNWKPSIRPPRFGGAKKVGVLASRSPHRPNPIGMSAVEIEKVDMEAAGGPEIFVKGVDLLDGTPVIDIKPYIAYTDCITNSRDGWASEPIPRYKVHYEPDVLVVLDHLKHSEGLDLQTLIHSLVELDPRPAFQKRTLPVLDSNTWERDFGFDLHGYEIKYTIRQGEFHILKIYKLTSEKQ